MKLGMNAKLYRNAGTYGTPTWTEFTNVRDLTSSDEMEEADATVRGSGGFGEAEPTIRNLSLEFDMKNEAGDADIAAVLEAYTGRTALDMAVMDGPIATVGSQGVRARYKVFSFGRDQNLRDGQMFNVTMKPAPNSDGPPEDMDITS